MGDRTGSVTRRWIQRLALAIVGLFALLLAAAAQESKSGKILRVGLLSDESVSGAIAAISFEAFSKGLHDLGWVEGQNFRFERRYGEGKSEALPELAAELVRLRIDMIVAFGTPATRAPPAARCRGGSLDAGDVRRAGRDVCANRADESPSEEAFVVLTRRYAVRSRRRPHEHAR